MQSWHSSAHVVRMVSGSPTLAGLQSTVELKRVYWPAGVSAGDELIPEEIVRGIPEDDRPAQQAALSQVCFLLNMCSSCPLPEEACLRRMQGKKAHWNEGLCGHRLHLRQSQTSTRRLRLLSQTLPSGQLWPMPTSSLGGNEGN